MPPLFELDESLKAKFPYIVLPGDYDTMEQDMVMPKCSLRIKAMSSEGKQPDLLYDDTLDCVNGLLKQGDNGNGNNSNGITLNVFDRQLISNTCLTCTVYTRLDTTA